MDNIAYEGAHSVDIDVPLSFAWKWRTDITNWDDPPAQFQLDGAFVRGAWGTTVLPGQQPLRWQIRDVQPGKSFIIEMPLDRAVLAFEWWFEAISERQTRITQRVVLSGDNAGAYAAHVRTSFESTLATGMNKIADGIVRAAQVMSNRSV
jgi:hypothetical protein